VRDFNLSLRLSEVSSLRQRNWSFATSAAIPPHLSTDEFEKSGKKSANVHRKFTIRIPITTNTPNIMPLYSEPD